MNAVRIEVLNKHNYESWRLQVEALLIKNDAWDYVNGKKPKPVEESALKDWEIADAKARADLILSMSSTELRHVVGCQTSRDVWLKLNAIHSSKGPARKAALLKQIMLQKLNEGEDVQEHIMKFFEAKDKLNEMQVEIHKDLLSIMLLYSLPASYENFRCAIESRDELPDPENLKVKIIEEHNSRHKSEPEVSFVRGKYKGKLSDTRKVKPDIAKVQFKYKCFRCHEPNFI